MKPSLDWSPSLLLITIREVLAMSPMAEIQTDTAKRCAESIGLHLVNLVETASDANIRGFHSVSLALCRSLEDALDCFAAVSLMPGAAEKWATGNLKASEAAKVWDIRQNEFTLPNGEKAKNYRKNLREYFNSFAHCSPYLTDWNLYPDILPEEREQIRKNPHKSIPMTVSFRVNHGGQALPQNSLRIGAYLAGHILEFVTVFEDTYHEYLKRNPGVQHKLAMEKSDLEEKLKTSFGAVFLEDRPPEVQNLVIPHPTDPDLITVIPLQPPAQ